MRIAQHSVAGEVVSRPQIPETPSGIQDQQALEEYACDRSNLPWIIFRAAHRAAHIAALPARARALLAALARTVDAARPHAAIFARRELLTGRAMQSMRTFYRSLDDLETAGFISRPPQTRYGSAGLFGRAYLHLTPKTAVLLGLSESKTEVEIPDDSQERIAQTESGLSLALPSATVAHGAIYKDLVPNTQKRQPGSVPADLQRLLTLGFREFLIFKLMRDAKRQGKLLSDVVEACWDHLRRATHPISYLLTLLRTPVDFGYRVRTQRVADVQREQQRERAEQVENAVADLAGESFVSRDGLRTYRIADDAHSVLVRHRDETQPRVHAGSWARAFLCGMEAGHIVPMNPHLSRSLSPREASMTEPTASVLPTPATSAAETSRSFAAELDGIKQMLRLKRAGIAPSKTSRDEAKQVNQEGRSSFPLSSLLQAISGATPSRT